MLKSHCKVAISKLNRMLGGPRGGRRGDDVAVHPSAVPRAAARAGLPAPRPRAVQRCGRVWTTRTALLAGRHRQAACVQTFRRHTQDVCLLVAPKIVATTPNDKLLEVNLQN